jgi:spore germination cell wall hydrolase CwlJ-like protein
MNRIVTAVAAAAYGLILVHAAPAGAQVVDRMIPAETRGLDVREHGCLTEAIYREAGSEPMRGRMAVAQVIVNRTQSGTFPGSVCGVVHQRGQFSFPKGLGPKRGPGEAKLWTEAQSIASLALRGMLAKVSSRSLYFTSAAARMPFGPRIRLIEVIGRHAFYAPR